MACSCGRCNRNNGFGNNGFRGPAPGNGFGPGAGGGFPGRQGRGQIRCGTGGTDAAMAAAATQAQAAAQAASADNGGVPRPSCDSVAAQVYGAQANSQPVLVNCCDACGGCRPYRLEDRSRFWPTFCHPRWLSCDQLYRRR